MGICLKATVRVLRSLLSPLWVVVVHDVGVKWRRHGPGGGEGESVAEDDGAVGGEEVLVPLHCVAVVVDGVVEGVGEPNAGFGGSLLEPYDDRSPCVAGLCEGVPAAVGANDAGLWE